MVVQSTAASKDIRVIVQGSQTWEVLGGMQVPMFASGMFAMVKRCFLDQRQKGFDRGPLYLWSHIRVLQPIGAW